MSPSHATKEERKWLNLGRDCGGMLFGSTDLIIGGDNLLKFVEAIKKEVLRESKART